MNPVIDEEVYFSNEILEHKRPFYLILASLSKHNEYSKAKVRSWLSPNLEILEQGLTYYNAEYSFDTFELPPSEVKVGPLTLKVTDKEKELIPDISKTLGIDPLKSYTLFKQFAASDSCDNSWLKYLCSPVAWAKRYTLEQVNSVTSNMSSAFCQFYFNERLSMLKCIILIAQIGSDVNAFFHPQVKSIFDSLIGSDHRKITPNALFTQLKYQVFRINEEDRLLWSRRIFQEYRAIIEALLALFKTGLYKEGRFISEYVDWYLKLSSRKLFQGYLFDPITESSLIETELFELALLIELLEFDKLDHKCDLMQPGLSALAQNPHLVLIVLKNVVEAPNEIHNSIFNLIFSVYSSSVCLSYSDHDLLPNDFSVRSIDVSDLLLHRSLQFKPLELLLGLMTSSSSWVANHNFSLIKGIFKLFLMSIPSFYPLVSIQNLKEYASCLVQVFQNEDKLCIQFWNEELRIKSRRCFLDLISSLFPAIDLPFLSVIKALSGTSEYSSSRMVEYLSNLPAFGYPVDEELKASSLVLDHPDGSYILELKHDLALFNMKYITDLVLREGTRGSVNIFDHQQVGIARWSFDYNGLDYLFAWLENGSGLIGIDNIPKDAKLDSLISSLGLLEKIASSPLGLKTLFPANLLHARSLRGRKIFVYHLISLFGQCISTLKLHIKLTSLLLTLFTHLSSDILDLFSSSEDSPTIDVFYKEDQSRNMFLITLVHEETINEDYSCLLSYLNFVLRFSQAFFSLVSKEGLFNSKYLILRKFVLFSFESILSLVSFKYVNWSYKDPLQRIQIGIKCMDIFSLFIAKDQYITNTNLDPFVKFFSDNFFELNGRHNLTPIISLIIEGNKIANGYSIRNQSSLSESFETLLTKSLNFLILLLKLTNSNPDLFKRDTLVNMILGPSLNNRDSIIVSCMSLVNISIDPKVSIKAIGILEFLSHTLVPGQSAISFSKLIRSDFDNTINNIFLILSNHHSNSSLKISLLDFMCSLSLSQRELLQDFMIGKQTIYSFAPTISTVDDLTSPSLLKYIDDFFQNIPASIDRDPLISAGLFKTLSFLWSHRNILTSILDIVAQYTSIWSSSEMILGSGFTSTEYSHILAIKVYIFEIVNYELAHVLAYQLLNPPSLTNPKFKELLHSVFETSHFSNSVKSGMYLPPIPESLVELKEQLQLNDINDLTLEDYINDKPSSSIYSLGESFVYNVDQFHSDLIEHYYEKPRSLVTNLMDLLKQTNSELSYFSVNFDLLKVQSEFIVNAGKFEVRTFLPFEVKTQISTSILHSFLDQLVSGEVELRVFNSEGLYRASSLILEAMNFIDKKTALHYVSKLFPLLARVYLCVNICLKFKSLVYITQPSDMEFFENTLLNWYKLIDVLGGMFNWCTFNWQEDNKSVIEFHKGFNICIPNLFKDTLRALYTAGPSNTACFDKLVSTGLISCFISSLKVGSQSNRGLFASWDSILDYGRFNSAITKCFFGSLDGGTVNSLVLGDHSARLLAVLSRYVPFRHRLVFSDFIRLIGTRLKELEIDFGPNSQLTEEFLTYLHIWSASLDTISELCSDAPRSLSSDVANFLEKKNFFLIQVLTKPTPSSTQIPLSYLILLQSLVKFITKLSLLPSNHELTKYISDYTSHLVRLASVVAGWHTKPSNYISLFGNISSFEMMLVSRCHLDFSHISSDKLCLHVETLLLNYVMSFLRNQSIPSEASSFLFHQPTSSEPQSKFNLSLSISSKDSQPGTLSYGTLVDLISNLSPQINQLISTIPATKLNSTINGRIQSGPTHPKLHGKINLLIIKLEILANSFSLLMKHLTHFINDENNWPNIQHHLQFDIITELLPLSNPSQLALRKTHDICCSTKLVGMAHSILNDWSSLEDMNRRPVILPNNRLQF